MKALNLCWKMPEISNMAKKYAGSASPLLWNNKKYNGTRQKAWCYDRNSAYSYAMLQEIPDTTNALGPGVLEEGQIGFIRAPKWSKPDEDQLMAIFEVGKECQWRFPAMKSPWVGFVTKYYTMKKRAKTYEEKMKAKSYLNVVIGNMQNHNPFIRSCIVTRTNNDMLKLIDENTLYVNTDSIISLVERKDLVIGDGIGEWKVEHEGLFAYKGFNYQWNFDVPSFRGVPKAWWAEAYERKEFDMLVDNTPARNNPFKLNMKDGHIYGC